MKDGGTLNAGLGEFLAKVVGLVIGEHTSLISRLLADQRFALKWVQTHVCFLFDTYAPWVASTAKYVTNRSTNLVAILRRLRSGVNQPVPGQYCSI